MPVPNRCDRFAACAAHRARSARTLGRRLRVRRNCGGVALFASLAHRRPPRTARWTTLWRRSRCFGRSRFRLSDGAGASRRRPSSARSSVIASVLSGRSAVSASPPVLISATARWRDPFLIPRLGAPHHPVKTDTQCAHDRSPGAFPLSRPTRPVLAVVHSTDLLRELPGRTQAPGLPALGS